MFVVFDLDGTIALIEHRRHFVTNGRRNWDAFFASCVDDEPCWPVIRTIDAHLAVGDVVEIWSGRSDQVRDETEYWLSRHDIDPALLTRMRSAGDHTPDVDLKRSWLHSIPEADRPDIVYDDRQRVVDMWRAEGVTCFQVAPGDFDKPRLIPPVGHPLLTIMVGPSGAGKSRYAERFFAIDSIVSSDRLRAEYTGDFRDQSRNDDVFMALHRLARARLECGLRTCVDATNLHRRDRLALLALLPEGARAQYVVIDRPLAEKVRDGGWRNDVIHQKSGLPLIQLHAQRFQQQLPNILRGDDRPEVSVMDLRQTEAVA